MKFFTFDQSQVTVSVHTNHACRLMSVTLTPVSFLCACLLACLATHACSLCLLALYCAHGCLYHSQQVAKMVDVDEDGCTWQDKVKMRAYLERENAALRERIRAETRARKATAIKKLSKQNDVIDCTEEQIRSTQKKRPAVSVSGNVNSDATPPPPKRFSPPRAQDFALSYDSLPAVQARATAIPIPNATPILVPKTIEELWARLAAQPMGGLPRAPECECPHCPYNCYPLMLRRYNIMLALMNLERHLYG